MAYASIPNGTDSLLQTLARPFQAIGNFLVLLAESNTLAKQANRIAEMSDEELSAQGLTRDEAIRDIFKAHYHV